MHRPSRVPALLFLVLILALAGPQAVRAWRIRPLYLDASVRDKANVALQQVSTSQGWNLSDMEIREVTTDGLAFLHREHRRNPDPPACFAFTFATSELHPCGS